MSTEYISCRSHRGTRHPLTFADQTRVQTTSLRQFYRAVRRFEYGDELRRAEGEFDQIAESEVGERVADPGVRVLYRKLDQTSHRGKRARGTRAAEPVDGERKCAIERMAGYRHPS